MTNEEKHLALCNLVSRGVPMVEARKRLDIDAPEQVPVEVPVSVPAPSALPSPVEPLVPTETATAEDEAAALLGLEDGEPEVTEPDPLPPVPAPKRKGGRFVKKG
jgi:hypothetical protein